MKDLSTPFSATIHTTHDHKTVSVGDADVVSVVAPLSFDHLGLLSVIHHLVDPLIIRLHENNDLSTLVNSCQFLVTIVPRYQVYCSLVVADVDSVWGLGAHLFLPWVLQTQQFEEPVT